MDLGLQDKVIVITGATRGIGAAITDVLLAEGARVAFCARSAEAVTARQVALEARVGPGRCFGHVADVGDAASLSGFLSAAKTWGGRVDGFISNASGGAAPGEEGWQAAFGVDVMGGVRGAEGLLADLAASGGAILFVASISGLEAMGDVTGYGPGKAALIAYASQLGDAAGRHGIRVNAISPGPIMVQGGFWDTAKAQNPQAVAGVEAQHPMGRLGTPEEVARAAAFLISPAASWVNRANMLVDGGFSRRIQY